MDRQGKQPLICHFFPGDTLQWSPAMIREFVTGHREMGTDLEEHRFVLFGNLSETQKEVYRGLGVPPDRWFS